MTSTLSEGLRNTPDRDGPLLTGVATPEQLDAAGRIYRLPETDEVRLSSINKDPETGELVQRLNVLDPYFAELAALNPIYAAEYALPEMRELQAQMGQLEEYLKANPDAEATAKGEAFIYDDSATMRKWREGFPQARALYPLRYPNKPTLPDGTPVDHWAYERFAYSLDAVGIRTRAVVTRHLITDYARQRLQAGNKDLELLSVACGAAVPVFEAMQQVHRQLPGVNAHVSAVDWDEEALGFAHKIASDYGLDERDFTTMKRNIIKDLMVTDRLAEDLPKKPDVVDMLGIFEYFDKEKAAKLLAKTYQLLGDEGMLVFGNMLDTHPQLQVNQRAVGWPIIKPRSIAEIKEIILAARDLGANIDMENVSIFVPEDGVYAVVRLVKKIEQQRQPDPNHNGHRKFGGKVIDFINHPFNSRRRHSHNGSGPSHPDMPLAA